MQFNWNKNSWLSCPKIILVSCSVCKTSLFHRFLLQIPLFKNQIRNIKEIHGKLSTPFWIIQAYKIKKQKVPSPTQDTIIHILTPLANLVNANFHKSSHQVLTMPAKTAQVFCLKYFCRTQQINWWQDVTACWTWLISCQNRKYVHQHLIIILWRHLSTTTIDVRCEKNKIVALTSFLTFVYEAICDEWFLRRSCTLTLSASPATPWCCCSGCSLLSDQLQHAGPDWWSSPLKSCWWDWRNLVWRNQMVTMMTGESMSHSLYIKITQIIITWIITDLFKILSEQVSRLQRLSCHTSSLWCCRIVTDSNRLLHNCRVNCPGNSEPCWCDLIQFLINFSHQSPTHQSANSMMK